MDPERVRELFANFRSVTPRRMFGGVGLFVDGVMFGIAFDGVIYLKTSEATLPAFQREGSAPFVYPLAKTPRHTNRGPSSYWRLPERLYDDPEELARWAAEALATKQSAAKATRKTQTARRRPPPRDRR